MRHSGPLASPSPIVSLWSELWDMPFVHFLFQDPQLASRAEEADTLLTRSSLAVPDAQRLEEDRQQRALCDDFLCCARALSHHVGPDVS